MDNIYRQFYTGNSNAFGIGTWDSKPQHLVRSGSMPTYKVSQNNPQNGNSNLKLPIINSRPNSNYEIKNNSKNTDSDTENYSDLNLRNSKDLASFMKEVNNSVAVRLQNDNLKAQQKLNHIKNNYNEIKLY